MRGLSALGGLLAVMAAGTLLQGQIIPPGHDCFETGMGSTRVIFGSALLPPLPADFFFPGSEPFTGVIELRGEPLPGYQWGVNTVVERKDPAVMPGPATVQVELKELHLVSISPITVWDSQDPPSPHYYNVDIVLNPNIPSVGFMVIEGGTPQGGSFSFRGREDGGISLYPRFTFVPLDGGPGPITWDSPTSELLETVSDQPWQYATPLLACEVGHLFYPVPGEPLRLVLDGGETGEHGVYPPWELMGCCLPGGTCIVVPGQDCVAMGGAPQLEFCAGYLEGCCIPQGVGMICVDVDPVCCDDLGGTPQGVGTGCVDMLIACCVPVGPTIVCVEVDPLCCDDLGGTPGYQPHCLGDLNGNDIDDACEPPPTEACCFEPDGWCQDLPPSYCLALGGNPQGPNTACAAVLIACCIPDDLGLGIRCLMTDPICCDDLGGTPAFWSECLGDQNENQIDDACELEACCFPGGDCQMLHPLTCSIIEGWPQGPGTFCMGLQACCLADGTCVMADGICCDDFGGTPQGLNTFCTQLQACCVPSMIEPGILCLDLDPLCCDDLGGTPQVAGTVCGDQPPIACCLPGGICWNVDRLCCDELGGTPGFAPQCLGDQNGNHIDDACEEPQVLEPKWSQPTHGGGQGFDAPSDLWWLEPELSIVWEQRPNPSLPGLHAHDWLDLGGTYNWITLADDWQWPEGREVSDLHWWGNYQLDDDGQEMRGAGVDHFHLSVHMCMGPGPQGWHVPMDPPIWVADVPFLAAQESFTGLINSGGSRIYRYRFEELLPIPPTWVYWLDVTAVSVDAGLPAVWRWQESNRRPYMPPPPEHPAPAAEQFNGDPWQTIMFGPGINTDMAFMVTSPVSLSPSPLPNKVVADDFISDGRPILALDWHGSYWDERYEPIRPPTEPYVLDGWFISFHHAKPDEWCPPDLSAIEAPTVLAVYFAPMEAVQWAGLFMADCFDHGIYTYYVDLSRCCLLCTHEDPRVPDSPPPGGPEGFREVAGLRYWLGIQAVVGVKWIKPACSYEQRILTGHLPPDLTTDGHFWGWHTSPADRLDEACTGRIVNFRPYPPQCWEYGEWQKQPWMCPETPIIPPVNMAFDLLAPPCAPMGDTTGDGVLDMNDVDCFVRCLIEDFSVGCWCGCADMNNDGVANGLDIQPFVNALLGIP